jgi:hypothetical protein
MTPSPVILWRSRKEANVADHSTPEQRILTLLDEIEKKLDLLIESYRPAAADAEPPVMDELKARRSLLESLTRRAG